jgi:hypothetical protein
MTKNKMVGNVYEGKKFAFDGFNRCHFKTDFLDKGSEAFYLVLDDNSVFVHILTGTLKRITKSYRNMDEFEKDFTKENTE